MHNWFIIQTNPNCEVKAERELRRSGFRVHLPKSAKVTRHHRTKKPIIVRRPAMPGYLFMRFPQGPNWYKLRQCQGVKGVLYSDGAPYELGRETVAAIIADQRKLAYDLIEARQYRQSRRKGERRTIASARFTEGMRVRASVAAGDILAEVTAITRAGTVRAMAEIMGAKRELEFTDLSMLEPEPELV